MDDANPLRLPKAIASDPRAPRLRNALGAAGRRLWPGGRLNVNEACLDEQLKEVLQAAHRAGRVVRSLEKAEIILEAEARGQGLADRRSGASRGVRVSRLLILSDDGAERFYRRVESLLERSGAKLVAVCLQADAMTLGSALFGEGCSARLVLVDHKEAVGDVLLALADQWTDPEAG